MFLFAVLFLSFVALARAETIHLKSGAKMEAKSVAVEGKTLVIRMKHGEVSVNWDELVEAQGRKYFPAVYQELDRVAKENAEQSLKEQEEARRAAEEAERLRKEKQAAEEAARLEQTRKQAEEDSRKAKKLRALTAKFHDAIADEENAVSKIRLMLAENPDLANAKDEDGTTPLHRAVSLGNRTIIQALLAAKTDVNASNSNGATPLFAALRHEDTALAQMLLEQKANPNSKNEKGVTPLCAAVAKGDAGLVKLLLEHQANVNGSGAAVEANLQLIGQSPPDHAGAPFKLTMPPGFGVEENAVIEMTPLHHAVLFKHKEIVELLLSYKADVAAKSSGNPTRTQLMRARHTSMGGDPRLLQLLVGTTPMHLAAGGDESIAQLLLAAKADVNAPDGKGLTPLHRATAAGSEGLVKLLLAAKANVNAQDEHGMTPLHTAATSGQKATAELLLAAKADVNAQDRNGATPLYCAITSNQKPMAALLVEHNADVNLAPVVGMTGSNTPLHHAVQQGDVELAELLLKHKADITAKYMGKTPFTAAKMGKSQKMVELLKQYGATE